MQQKQSEKDLTIVGTEEEENRDLDAIFNAAKKITNEPRGQWSQNPTYSNKSKPVKSNKNSLDPSYDDPDLDNIQASIQKMAKELELEAIQHQMNKEMKD